MPLTHTKSQTTNVAIGNETHKLLVAHIQSIDGKIGRFVDNAILEKMGNQTVIINICGVIFSPSIYIIDKNGYKKEVGRLPHNISAQIVEYVQSQYDILNP